MSSQTQDGKDGGDRSVQDAMTTFMQTENPDGDDVRDLIDAAAETTDRSDVDTAIAVAENRSSFDEDELRAMLDRKRRQGFEIREIVKYTPWSSEEDCEWHFHVTAYGEEEMLVMGTKDLRDDRVFRDRMMEVLNQVVPEFDDWEAQLDTWLSENEIEVRRHQPLSGEHAIAEHILGAIDRKYATTDREKFRSFPTSYIFCGGTDDETVLVAGELVDECRSQVPGEVAPRKVRDILEPMLSGGSKRIRSEGRRFRVWQFDHEALNAEGVELEWEEEDDADVSLDREGE